MRIASIPGIKGKFISMNLTEALRISARAFHAAPENCPVDIDTPVTSLAAELLNVALDTVPSISPQPAAGGGEISM